MLGVLEPEWYGMHGVWRGQKHQVMTPCPWVREGEMYMGYCTAASGYGRSLGLRLDSCTCGDEFRGRNGMYGSEIGQSHSVPWDPGDRTDSFRSQGSDGLDLEYYSWVDAERGWTVVYT